MINSRYRDAFEEVYVILDYLDYDDYWKISQDFLDVIEKNRNKEHEFDIDWNVSLNEQKIMNETKAILFNLFHKNFATPQQKETIQKMWREEIQKEEEKKRKIYETEMFTQQNASIVKEEQKENIQLVEYKENIFKKFLKRLKEFFGF